MVKLHQQQTANLRPSMRDEDNVTAEQNCISRVALEVQVACICIIAVPGLWQDHCAGELVVVVVAAVTT